MTKKLKYISPKHEVTAENYLCSAALYLEKSVSSLKTTKQLGIVKHLQPLTTYNDIETAIFIKKSHSINHKIKIHRSK